MTTVTTEPVLGTRLEHYTGAKPEYRGLGFYEPQTRVTHASAFALRTIELIPGTIKLMLGRDRLFSASDEYRKHMDARVRMERVRQENRRCE